MRVLRLLLLTALSLWHATMLVRGGEFRLSNGDVVRGEPVSFNDDGMVVRLEIGGHSPRLSWSKLTQETLKELSANPQAAKFVEPFIELPPVPKDKDKKKKEIVLKPVPRAERVEKPNFFASFFTPVGLATLFVLLLANVYAGYEIARYRYRPPGLVCGLSVLFPVIAPLLFLAMPPPPGVDTEAAGASDTTDPAQVSAKSSTGPLAKTPMASGLSVAQADKGAAAPAAAGPQSYKRGEFTFNRRFMETKFPGLFRVVQSEADKDMVLIVRTAKEEHTAKRISRISSSEMHVQLLRGGEVSVSFGDITEVLLRHKDSKG